NFRRPAEDPSGNGVFPRYDPHGNRCSPRTTIGNCKRSHSNRNVASEETVATVFMSMKHTELTEELQERASLYAAGAMTDSEKLEYLRHLEDDQCAVCRAEVDELQSAISLLAFTVPAASPS